MNAPVAQGVPAAPGSGPMAIGLGMPPAPPPVHPAARRARSWSDRSAGSDHPISVQSMCTTKTHDVNATLQQIAQLTASGCDIVRGVPASGGCRRTAGDRPQGQHPGDRRHPLPAQVHLRRHRRRLRRGAGEPRQHQGVRRPRQGGRQGRRRGRHSHPDRRQRRIAGQAADGEIRQGDAWSARRVGAVGGEPVRGIRLPATSRSRSNTTTR